MRLCGYGGGLLSVTTVVWSLPSWGEPHALPFLTSPAMPAPPRQFELHASLFMYQNLQWFLHSYAQTHSNDRYTTNTHTQTHTHIHTQTLCTSLCMFKNLKWYLHSYAHTYQGHIHKQKHIHTYMYRDTHMHAYIRTHMNRRVHADLQDCIHTYIHTYRVTYLHTHIHVTDNAQA